LNRRQFLEASALTPLATLLPGAVSAASAADLPFGPSYVRELARNLASKPFAPPEEKVPDALKDLTYDQYRSIRFLPERAAWRSEKLPFEVVRERIADRLRSSVQERALRQYVSVLAGAAVVEGAELDAAASPLVP